MEKEYYKEIIDKFCFESFWLRGVRIEVPDGFKTVKRDFDLILFHPKKVIFIAKVPDNADLTRSIFAMRAGLNCLCNKLSLSMNHFVVCGVNKNGFFTLNKYIDQVEALGFSADGKEHFEEFIENELSFGPDVFDRESMVQMRDTLKVSPGVIDKDIAWETKRVTADGKVYIRKHGSWKEASAIHPETLFLLTVFGGIWGVHLFFQKKYFKGILYLFTLGLFGFGWFFDSIEILLGIYKDPDGRYIAPLESRFLGLMMLLCGALTLCLVGSVIFFFANHLFL